MGPKFVKNNDQSGAKSGDHTHTAIGWAWSLRSKVGLSTATRNAELDPQSDDSCRQHIWLEVAVMSRSAGPITTWQAARARIDGFSSRPNRPANDPEVIEAYQQLKFFRLKDHVEEVLAAGPPLTEEQCRHLADMLLAGGEN
jgi:hypothetical protein